MAYSILAPGVSVENFGAGQGQSRLQRFTSGLYGNLTKSDALDTMLMKQRSNQATQPYKDQAAIAKARQDTKEAENKTIMAMIAQRTAVCTAAPGSAECLAWDRRIKAIETQKQVKADTVDGTNLATQQALTASKFVLPSAEQDAANTQALAAQLEQIEADRQAEEDAAAEAAALAAWGG